MGWFSEVVTEFIPVCPRCGKNLNTMQTKGYKLDEEYYLENGKPYRAPLETAMIESSETNDHGVTTLETISDCDCGVYASWTFFKQKELKDKETK